MKLWMLGNRLTTETYERSRFVEEADKYGIDFTVHMLMKLISSFQEMTVNLFGIVMMQFLSLTVYLLVLGLLLVILTSVFSDSLKD